MVSPGIPKAIGIAGGLIALYDACHIGARKGLSDATMDLGQHMTDVFVNANYQGSESDIVNKLQSWWREIMLDDPIMHPISQVKNVAINITKELIKKTIPFVLAALAITNCRNGLGLISAGLLTALGIKVIKDDVIKFGDGGTIV